MMKLLSVVTAILISFGLFVAMTYLIKAKNIKVDTIGSIDPITIDYKEINKPIVKRKYELAKLPEKIDQPIRQPTEIVKPTNTDISFNSDIGFGHDNANNSLRPNFIKMMSSNFDSGQPRVRIQPKYPATASMKGIEGYVTLEFDVSAVGTTQNIRVVDSKPRGIFDKSARKALKKWKYSPKIIDEKPVEQLGHRVTLEFKLESEA